MAETPKHPKPSVEQLFEEWKLRAEPSLGDNHPANLQAAFFGGFATASRIRPLVHTNPNAVIAELHYQIDRIERMDYESASLSASRRRLIDAITRIKLNYALLQYLQQHKLLPDFKEWYFQQQEQEQQQERDKPAVPTFSR